MSTGRHNNAILGQLKHGQRSLISWLLRSLIVMRRSASTSGFVLPTVAMVSLVVVLLTTAILVRSFDRSRNASNFRVSEAALNAATPALDRARAKIDALLIDQTLPQVTPTDAELETALNRNSYTLGDETRLKLAQDSLPNDNQDHSLTTAWKFPVDTDSNGKFDSYTLYGIYFRRGAQDRRNSLQTRTPPMQGELLGRECENIVRSSNRPLGNSGWYQTGSKLSKSFFVYTATVPITNPPIDNNYEAYRGNRSFYALEFQQDRSRIPLKNHAALFQNDLEITPDANFRLNGKVATNGNLLVGGTNNQTSRLYQVSSQYSCFYNEENGKITVGGNVGLGNVADTSDRTPVTIDLFDGFGNQPTTVALDRNIKSTTTPGGAQVGYNDAAYNHRIALMKQTALYFHPNFNRRNTTDEIPTVESVAAVRQYPQEVKEGFKTAIADTPTQRGSSFNAWEVLEEQIETYLKNLTRRVPYAEIATSDRRSALNRYDFDEDGIDTSVFTTDAIEPPLEWREPTPTNTRLTLNQYNLPQTQPEQQHQAGKETYVGDRISVGNNLPTFWKKAGNFFLGFNEKQLFDNNITWTNPNTQPRYRTTQTLPIPDRKIVERNNFWENAAAQQFSTTLNDTGGLRLITGAGIYLRENSNTFLPEPKLAEGVTEPAPFTTRAVTSNNANIVVWSDALPMSGDADDQGKKSDLQMRATVVYHYKDSAYTDTDYIERTPTACVSSYYDPTNAITARNQNSLPDVSGVIEGAQPSGGRSNNGVVYPSPYNGLASREAAVNQYRDQLDFQARLIFPNGRVVNQPLRDALVKIDANRTRSLAENSAIDAVICAIRIVDGDLSPTGNPIIPHGAIKEASFLDAREIQAVDKEQPNYDLELEKRQPTEIRVTDIDLGLLAKTRIGAERSPQEYLLPNSGIVYASRDDALADASDTTTESELISPTDFVLDPTRRPSGIRLINGSNLARENEYRTVEKGLTFVTNLPAYILGDFNLHQQPLTRTSTEEFLERLTPNWTNFYSRNSAFDNSFACIKGQRGCGNNGDQWRPATIISDAVTVLSNSFVDGFRSDGDYDLNNYAGTSVTTQRKKNGFYDNSFVTSSSWFTNNTRKNSYLNNGVTPIQRRANFPEYVMEICRKITVSECKPNDWVVGYDGNKDVKAASLPEEAKAARLIAGTTARSALNPEDRRYARRIAFQRNELGTLELSDFQNISTPIPLGINSADEVESFLYSTYNSKRPKSVDNALWFRTTSDPKQPDSAPSYQSDRPLAYMPNTQLISPSTPDIPGIPSLNQPESDPASGYTICTTLGRYFKQYEFVSGEPLQILAGECGPNVQNQIQIVYTSLRNLNPDTDANDDIVEATQQGNFEAGRATILTANDSKLINIADVNVERIPTNNVAATTIRLVGQEDSIFIIRNDAGNLQFGTGGEDHHGVNIELVGVSPNNVFWVVNGNLVVNQVADDKRHSLVGTFLNNAVGTPTLKNVEINGRLLGFGDLPQAGANFTAGSKITAITSDEQPLLIPVLQIHSPNGSPGGSTLDRGSAELQDQWLQTPENDTTVNAVIIAGNSPSRPQEEPAGLQNFVRLLENWQNRTLNIKGSFIQLYRSAYATAPFAPILAGKSTANDGTLSIFGYDFTQYRTSNGQFAGTLPYFSAPNRQWSFDVGLLSQSPDLFAQKFTQPVQTPTNEFIREVNREDSWIETLLCAAQGAGNNYNYAVEESDRPRSCPPLTAYQDQTPNN